MKKVLIVDDNGINLYVLKSLLEAEGFQVIAAANGKEALERAQADPPDLIISDILMPVMDGYAFCRQCKLDENLQKIPFIFYTATYTEPKDEAFALSLGADRFVLKPQEPEALLRIMKEVWEERSAAGSAAPKPLGEEMEFFRQYNEILFGKLEKKMIDLEHANQRLKALEEQYRLSFGHVADVIFTIDKDLGFLSISPSVERILGFKSEEFIGRPVTELAKLLTPDSFEQAVADLSSVLSGQTVLAATYRFIAKGGTIKHGEVSGSPMMRDGQMIGITGVARDITDRIQAEEKLRESERRYRLLVENANEAILVIQDGMIRYVNHKALESYGYSEKEFLSIPVFDLVHPDDREEMKKRYLQKIAGDATPTRHTYRTLHKNGRIIWMENSSVLIEWEGRPATLNLILDMTEQKLAEQMAFKSMERLRRSLAGTVQAISMAVETRDPYTAGHQRRTADLARSIAAEMGFPSDRTDFVRIAASIHDIGKISVPAEILSKPSKLREIEFSLIKVHPQAGYDILKDIDFPWPVAEVILQHHERLDGSGYPEGLRGDAILMEARILSVADVVEAIASHRPYRAAMGVDAAMEEISKNRGILYDPMAVDACLKLFTEKGYRLQ